MDIYQHVGWQLILTDLPYDPLQKYTKITVGNKECLCLPRGVEWLRERTKRRITFPKADAYHIDDRSRRQMYNKFNDIFEYLTIRKYRQIVGADYLAQVAMYKRNFQDWHWEALSNTCRMWLVASAVSPEKVKQSHIELAAFKTKWYYKGIFPRSLKDANLINRVVTLRNGYIPENDPDND